jgi:hypothetical protein
MPRHQVSGTNVGPPIRMHVWSARVSAVTGVSCALCSLQIVPSADIPFLCKKDKGKGTLLAVKPAAVTGLHAIAN